VPDTFEVCPVQVGTPKMQHYCRGGKKCGPTKRGASKTDCTGDVLRKKDGLMNKTHTKGGGFPGSLCWTV